LPELASERRCPNEIQQVEINADLAAKDDPFEGIKSGSRRQA
jgi:hypothetical protein